MLRWIYLAGVACMGFPCQGQPLDYFCKDTTSLYADPEAAEIVYWLMPVFREKIHQHGEVVQRLLSHEVLGMRMGAYPCLSLAYHIRLATALRDMGVYDDAGRFAQQALEIASEYEREYLSDVLSLSASIAYQDQDFESAIEYYKTNLTFVLENSSVQALAGAYNNLALTYLELDSLERATMLFNIAYCALDSARLQDTHVGAAILDNLAETALLAGDTLRAFELLRQKEQTLSRIAPDTIRILNTWISLAGLYLLRKQASDAYPYLSKARILAEAYGRLPLAKAFHLESLWFDYHTTTRQHAAMEASMHRLRRLFSRYAEEVTTDRALLSDALRINAQHSVQQVMQMAEVQIEKHAQEQRFRSGMAYLWLFLALLAFLCIAGYFYYRNIVNRQRIRSLNLSVSLHDQLLRNKQLEKDLLQKDLEARGHDLTSVAMDNIQRRDWTADVMEKLSAALALPAERHQEEIKKIYYHLLHQHQIQERLSLPQEHHELVNKSFFDKLKSTYPDLSENEIDLCMMLRLGLSGKEIAVLRNVDPESIRKAKYRLRKHMDFPTPEALREYLNTL